MARKPVIVLGSLNVDIVARVAALPRPGETALGGELSVRLGGKGANQAIAAAQAGARVAMRGAIGVQSFGLDLRGEMTRYGVDMSEVAEIDGASGAALIAVDDQGENAITVSPGANARASGGALVAPSPGALMLAQLELPPALARAAFAAQKAGGGATMLNAAPALAVPDDLFALCDYLILNEAELSTYTDRALKADAPALVVKAAAHELRRPGQTLIVTLGARGALAVDGRGALSIPARPAKARDTTGAGDCFCGALAARLAEGAALEDALNFAAAAAAISVTRDGAAPSMPDRAEIDAALA